ncbi:Hypothetical protein DAL_154 [Psychrobacter phage D'Alembert]|nr:Hypothetical protein DAL_11 [Psychrobacter phage D'Alembert]CAH1193566.1 Hypothetical protein DAL_154 [Psychrobacter phage D'Alembert]
MTTLNTNTLAQVQISQVIEQLKQDDSTLLQAYSEYASSNGYDSVYDNDEDNINMFFSDSRDAIRSAFYGDYNLRHAYFTFNGYGNLQSFEYLISDNSPIDIEELAQWIVDNELHNDYDIEVTTLEDMLASIEDNITDDSNMLKVAINYLSLEDDNDSSYDEKVFDVLNELNHADYETIKSVIDRLGINYE